MLRAILTFVIVTAVLVAVIGALGWIGSYELLVILLFALAAATIVRRKQRLSS